MASLSGDQPREISSSRPGFVDLDTLTDAHGIRAVISQRSRDGVITLGVFRVFERDGAENRTSFIPENLFGAYKALVELAIERIEELKRGKLPFARSAR